MIYYRRLNSLRIPGYDYTRPGYYFVTILTKNRKELFGEITDDRMQLSEYGKAAVKIWEGLPQFYPNMRQEAFVILPDHIHVLIKLVKCKERTVSLPIIIQGFKSWTTKELRRAGVAGADKTIWHRSYHCRIPWQPDHIDRIIAYIKNNLEIHLKENKLPWAIKHSKSKANSSSSFSSSKSSALLKPAVMPNKLWKKAA